MFQRCKGELGATRLSCKNCILEQLVVIKMLALKRNDINAAKTTGQEMLYIRAMQEAAKNLSGFRLTRWPLGVAMFARCSVRVGCAVVVLVVVVP